MKRNNDRILLEGLVRKYGVNSVINAIKNINESTNNDHIVVLYSSLPEDYDQYRDAYDEDVEVGEINPKEWDYERYSDRLSQLFAMELEADIKRNDVHQYYVTFNERDKEDVNVHEDLWHAIRVLVTDDDFKVSFVEDHFEVEVAHYNSQNRSYYKIYALNKEGEKLLYWDEEVYNGHDSEKLHNKKYWSKINLK